MLRFESADVASAKRAFVRAIANYARDYFEAYDIDACFKRGYASCGPDFNVQLHWSDS
jgi:hypothetical protein